jgi:threonine synthase
VVGVAGGAVGVAGGGGGAPLVRYRHALPPGAGRVDLGLRVTPVSEVRPGLFVKADYEQPTGSFKDRGSSVMLGAAMALGIRSVVVDSSGNAGLAAAAHASRAGIECSVYVPAGTAPAKVAAIATYGATVVEVPGGRRAAALAAQDEVRATGRWYASHVYQPLFHYGVKTLAYELYEQVPDIERATVVVPAGNGTLVLGLWLGFGDLVALGRLGRRPTLMAVQAVRCAPLAGLEPSAATTSATGIAIPDPPRGAQVRAAVVATGGRVLVVGEEAILGARSDLARLGFEVEPTGAVAWAAAGGLLPRPWGGEGRRGHDGPGPAGVAGPAGPVVAVLTGR